MEVKILTKEEYIDIVIKQLEVLDPFDIINEYSVLDLQMDLDESVVTVKKNFNNTDKKEIADTQESKKYVNKFRCGYSYFRTC